MTLSQIRRRVNVLMRRSAPELAIIRLRRIAEAVSDDWDPDQPPEPADVIARVAKAGFRMPTFMRLRRYLDDTIHQGDESLGVEVARVEGPEVHLQGAWLGLTAKSSWAEGYKVGKF